jgi:predicted DCC family thiol-disulfide oxidoreductase YuxK
MKAYMLNIWQRFIDWTSQDRLLIGASVFRILAGMTILYQYLINYHQRHYLFGPEAAWPYDVFAARIQQSGSFSLYAINPSLPWFEFVFHLGIIVTTLWVIGWRTRLMTVLAYAFYWSAQERTPVLWDGGDNIMSLVFIYAFFANLGAHFSFDAARLRRARERGGLLQKALSMTHNAALLAFALQLCLLYGVSGLYKVQGEMWQNGTALYYIMRVDEFNWRGVSELVYTNAFLMTAGTYATVAFQVAFPFLFFMNRYTRLFALAMGFGFHLSIGAFMGLVTFSAFMISVELALITDNEYRSFRRRLSNFFGRLAQRVVNVWGRMTQSPRLEPVRIKVFYDGWCPFCRQSIERLRSLDTLSLLEPISFREPGVLAQYNLDAERLEARIHARTARVTVEGIDAMTLIAMRLPLLWPTVPLLWVAVRLGVGQQVYDWIAARRTIIPSGCADACPLPTAGADHGSHALRHAQAAE